MIPPALNKIQRSICVWHPSWPEHRLTSEIFISQRALGSPSGFDADLTLELTPKPILTPTHRPKPPATCAPTSLLLSCVLFREAAIPSRTGPTQGTLTHSRCYPKVPHLRQSRGSQKMTMPVEASFPMASFSAVPISA